MSLFGPRFYAGSKATEHGVEQYRALLLQTLSTSDDRSLVLKEEIVAITKTITDGIRDLIATDRNVRHLVLDLAVVPLATWAAALDKMSAESLPALKRKIAEMEHDLEHRRIGPFPGTMLLNQKPTFTTFAPFYEVVFSADG